MIPKFLNSIKMQIAQTGKCLQIDPWSDWHINNVKQYKIEQIATYCFVVDAMNFCFWPNNPAGVFEYEHITRNLEKLLINDPKFFTC